MSASDSLESVEIDLRRRKPRKSRSQVIRETFGYCESEIEDFEEEGHAGDLSDYITEQVRHIRKKVDEASRFEQTPARDSGSISKFLNVGESERRERINKSAGNIHGQGHAHGHPKIGSVGIGRERPFNSGTLCESPPITAAKALKTIKLGQHGIPTLQPGGRESKPRINIQSRPTNPVDLKSPYRTAIKTTDLLGYTNPWSFQKYQRDEQEEHRDQDRLRSPCLSKTFHASVPVRCYNYDGSIVTAVQSYNSPRSTADDETVNNENARSPARRHVKGTKRAHNMASEKQANDTTHYTESKTLRRERYQKPKDIKGDDISLSYGEKKSTLEHAMESSGTEKHHETVNQKTDFDLAHNLDTESIENTTNRDHGERESKKSTRVPKNANKPRPRSRINRALKEPSEVTEPRFYYRTEAVLTTEDISRDDGSHDINKEPGIERWRDELHINRQYHTTEKTLREQNEVETEKVPKRADTPTTKGGHINAVKSVYREEMKRNKPPAHKVKAINIIEKTTLQEDKTNVVTRIHSNTKIEKHTKDVTNVHESMDLKEIKRHVLSRTNACGLSSVVSCKSTSGSDQNHNDVNDRQQDDRKHEEIQSASNTSVLEVLVLNSDTTLERDTSRTIDTDIGIQVRIAFAPEPRPKRSLLKSLRHNIRRFGSFVIRKMSYLSCSDRVSVL